MEKPRKVLVVDDDKNFREILSKPFLKKGDDVTIVENADQAIEQLDKQFDRVVVDGLGGEWTKVVQNTGSARVTLASADDLGKLAKRANIEFVSKSDRDSINGLADD